jgi:hypothetical protein
VFETVFSFLQTLKVGERIQIFSQFFLYFIRSVLIHFVCKQTTVPFTKLSKVRTDIFQFFAKIFFRKRPQIPRSVAIILIYFLIIKMSSFTERLFITIDVPACWLGQNFDITHRLSIYGIHISLVG